MNNILSSVFKGLLYLSCLASSNTFSISFSRGQEYGPDFLSKKKQINLFNLTDFVLIYIHSFAFRIDGLFKRGRLQKILL
jgi:hypothetical protein